MNPIILDKVRGCMLGGAVGDALGYPVMNLNIDDIRKEHGENGISEYLLDENGKAGISDITQLSLFTANGILAGKTKACKIGTEGPDVATVCQAYKDWVKTQESDNTNESHTTWLYNIENLHSRRHSLESGIDIFKGDFGSVEKPEKLGMDFGAITRIAPVGLYFKEENMQIEEIDVFAANVAASTHGYDAAYISAAILAHIINKVTYTEMTLKEAVSDAMNTVKRLCGYKPHVESVMEGLSIAVSLAGDDIDDKEAVSEIGIGNSADEVLAAAIYFSLKYEEDFEKAIHAAVNNDGKSGAIASVTGNILGAYLGARAIPEKYLEKLELRHIIQIIAEDLHEDCPNTNYFDNFNWIWEEKYGEACYII